MVSLDLMKRLVSTSTWGVVIVLGLFMLGRGIWALQQPWRSTGEKLFALAFFAALTGFAGYRLVVSLRSKTSGLGGPRRENLAYAMVSLVFVVGAVFVLLHGSATSTDLLAAAGGILFFGGGAVVFFMRARRS